MKLKTKKNKQRTVIQLSSLCSGDTFYHSEYDNIHDAMMDDAIHLVTTVRQCSNCINVVNVVTGHLSRFFLVTEVVEVEGELKLSEKKK